MAKASAKSAIRTNLSSLTNGISAQPTVFSEVVNACGEKKLITSKQAKEYVDNSAGKEIGTRASNLVHNIMTVTDVIPESLDTFLCILYDSEDLILRQVASSIAKDYGHNLHKYNTRLADDINEDIPAKTPVSNLSSNSPPSPPSPPRKPSKSNHSSLFSYLMKPFVLVVIVAVIGASPFLYSYLDLGGKGPEDTSIKPPMVEENLNNADVPSQHIDSDTPPNNDPLPPSSSKSLKSRDLFRIIKLLNDNDYDVGTWSDLCLALGLSQSRINTIKKDEMDSSDRLRSCLSKWLNRVDQVDQFGGATLASLLTALENIGQKPVAEEVKERTN